jgi:hypothetical protein
MCAELSHRGVRVTLLQVAAGQSQVHQVGTRQGVAVNRAWLAAYIETLLAGEPRVDSAQEEGQRGRIALRVCRALFLTDDSTSMGALRSDAAGSGPDLNGPCAKHLAQHAQMEVNDVLAAAFLENAYGGTCKGGLAPPEEGGGEETCGSDWRVRVWKRINSLCECQFPLSSVSECRATAARSPVCPDNVVCLGLLQQSARASVLKSGSPFPLQTDLLPHSLTPHAP